MYQYLKDAVKLFAHETEDLLRQQLTACTEENRSLREKMSCRNMAYMLAAISIVVLVTFVGLVAHGFCHNQ